MSYHLFLSYARADNTPAGGHPGWVSAFDAELKRRHAAYSGRELKVFFDTQSIDTGRDWRRELGLGLRQSKLFLAFLSPNYLTSPNCLWEWEEYLRREHSAARGDDGMTPIYFVTPADLRLAEQQSLAEWLAQLQQRYPWFQPRDGVNALNEAQARRFVKDLNRRNKTHELELQPWYAQGPRHLLELDAAERSAAVKQAGPDLAERLSALDRHIARRLDRLQLADLAIGNIPRAHEHFVGRHRELSELHTIMLAGGAQSGGSGMGGRGLIAATFAPGGLGKTALARQYGHAYAEYYAAGGIWEIGCAGLTELGAALLRLADDPRFLRAGVHGYDIAAQRDRWIAAPLQLGEAERASYPLAAAAILHYLAGVTAARKAVLREQLGQLPERHCPLGEPPELGTPRALLILDNVDQPELLSARQLAQLPAAEWLELIVTTRLDPAHFGGGERSFKPVEVGVLPPEDALQLLADFQPDYRYANDAEAQAASAIVTALGGWTLALEIAGAYIGHLRSKSNPQAAQAFLRELEGKGLAWVDDLSSQPAVDQVQRHAERPLQAQGTEAPAERHERQRQNRVGTLVRWSQSRLSPPARLALDYASLLMPDAIPLDWLRQLCVARFPDVDHADLDHDWHSIWHELHGLRLLHPAGDGAPDTLPTLVRIHRLVAEHVRDKTAAERLADLDAFLEALAIQFEQQVGQTDDAALRAQHPWLRDQLSHLLATQTATPSLLRSAGVAASFEGDHGALGLAIQLTETILAGKQRLLGAKPESAALQRDVSVILIKLADFLAHRGQPGDAEAALAHCQQCHEVLQQLWAANPNYAQAARDVSVSLNKLADFLASRGQPGDAEAALAHYQQSLSMAQQLWAANPNSAQAARDVSISLDRLGDFLATRGQPGDAEAALAHYQQSLSVRQQLWAANPNSAQAARDVSVSLERLGDFLASRGQPGDAEAALAHYQQSLSVRQQLWAANPNSAQAARDVSVSLNQLADFLASRGQPGDAEAALAHYQQSLSVRQQLWAANPNAAQAARDLMVSHERLSSALAARKDGAHSALEHQQHALALATQLHQHNPGSWYYQRTAIISNHLTAIRAQAAGVEPLFADALLELAIQNGMAVDPAMRQLHAQLAPYFRPST
jgi:hypothetical protein